MDNKNELAQRPSGVFSLAPISRSPLPVGTLASLALMMAEAQAEKPNQVLEPLTVDRYAIRWEEMALKYGLEIFRGALSKALCDSEFFPTPNAIGGWCESLSDSQIMRERGRQAVREHDERVAAYKAERAQQ